MWREKREKKKGGKPFKAHSSYPGLSQMNMANKPRGIRRHSISYPPCMSSQRFKGVGRADRHSHLHAEEVSKTDLSDIVANILIVKQRCASNVGVAGLHGNVGLDHQVSQAAQSRTGKGCSSLTD